MEDHDDYNLNLCRICQSPNCLNLENTSSTVPEGEETYLDVLKFIFTDILWVDEDLISFACTMCLKKITDTAEFKRLCLKTNFQKYSRNAFYDTKEEISSHKIDFEIVENDQDDSSPEDVQEDWSLLRETEEPTVEISKRETLRVNTNKNNDKVSKEMTPKLLICEKEQMPKHRAKRKARTNKTQVKEVAETPSSSTMLNDPTDTKKPTKRKRERLKPTMTAESKPKCDICGEEAFKNHRELERHIFRHNGTRNYVCPICGRKYITNGDLITHAKSHSDELKFKCDICHKRFKAVRNLQTHKAIVHVDPKDYKHLCTICGNKFVTAERLKEHIKRHNQVKKFPCDLCEKTFVSKSEMLKHAITHSNVRAFKCDLCPIEYKQKDFLLAHKSRKHGVGKFRKRRLKQCEKPYQCRECDTKFICKSNIKSHLKKKHDINVDMKRDFDPVEYYIVLEPSQQDIDEESP